MKSLRITVNGTAYDVQVEELGTDSAPAVSAPAPAKAAPAPKATPAPSGNEGSVKVTAPMPGTVVRIEVNTGDAVKAGQDLIFIEAMKMETPVKAAQDGTVASIAVQKGESVDTGKVLLTMN
ncbi:MAG: biotin/lipoyl-binding protein [Ruminococcus sp.]|nr:biotin/lipoyl-binding protein [Ruminococcus sp.]